MDYVTLSNQALIEECQKEPLSELAWKHFVERFHKHVSKCLYRHGKKLRVAKSHSDLMDKVQDSAQNVLLKLVANDRNLIKNFRNETENAIWAYLAMISKSEMMNYKSSQETQKRKGKHVSFDQPIETPAGHRNITWEESISETIYDPELKERFDNKVEKLLEKLNALNFHRHKARNVLIFKLHVLKDLTPKEIFSVQGFNRSANLSEDTDNFGVSEDHLLLLNKGGKMSLKRIQNLISDIRKQLKDDW